MKKQNTFTTDFLFSMPTFFSGAGTVMNLAGNYYEFNTSDTEFEADERAIENDFRMIGQDIAIVIDKLSN